MYQPPGCTRAKSKANKIDAERNQLLVSTRQSDEKFANRIADIVAVFVIVQAVTRANSVLLIPYVTGVEITTKL